MFVVGATLDGRIDCVSLFEYLFNRSEPLDYRVDELFETNIWVDVNAPFAGAGNCCLSSGRRLGRGEKSAISFSVGRCVNLFQEFFQVVNYVWKAVYKGSQRSALAVY